VCVLSLFPVTPPSRPQLLPNNKATEAPISFGAVFESPVFAFPVPELTAIGGKEKLYTAYGFTHDNVTLDKMRHMSAQKIKDLAAINRVVPAIAVKKHHVVVSSLPPLIFHHI
jgi:hypothetical protein